MHASGLSGGVQHGLWLAIEVTHGENAAGCCYFCRWTAGGFLGGGFGLHVRHHDGHPL
jgi:hypothetical protein